MGTGTTRPKPADQSPRPNSEGTRDFQLRQREVEGNLRLGNARFKLAVATSIGVVVGGIGQAAWTEFRPSGHYERIRFEAIRERFAADQRIAEADRAEAEADLGTVREQIVESDARRAELDAKLASAEHALQNAAGKREALERQVDQLRAAKQVEEHRVSALENRAEQLSQRLARPATKIAIYRRDQSSRPTGISLPRDVWMAIRGLPPDGVDSLRDAANSIPSSGGPVWLPEETMVYLSQDILPDGSRVWSETRGEP